MMKPINFSKRTLIIFLFSIGLSVLTSCIFKPTNFGVIFEKTVNPVEVKTTTIEPMMTNQLSTEPTKDLGKTVTPETIITEDSEIGLEKFLRTNGGCVGQCIGGIQFAEMSLQDVQNVMSYWGKVRTSRDEQKEVIYINLEETTVYDRIKVYLSVGLTADEQEINRIFLRFEGLLGNYLGTEGDIWGVESEIMKGYELKNLLQSYGIPDEIYIYFASNAEGGYKPLERKEILYYLTLFYENLNLTIDINGLTYVEDYSFEICPAEDPHNLWIEYNSEVSLERIQQSSVSWVDFIGEDPESFYSTFMDEDEDNHCFSATIEKIRILQPWFR